MLKKLLWGFASAASLTLLLGLILTVSNYLKRPSPEVEVRGVVDDIRGRVSSITLEESHVVFKDRTPPQFQYKLTINPSKATDASDEKGKLNLASDNSVYLFPKYEYTLTTGGQESKIPTSNICELMDAIYNRKDPILEALRDLKLNGKVSVPVWKVFGGDLEAGNVTPIVIETLYALRKFEELQTTHAEILVRGYADGQSLYWERSIKADYPYDRISVYPQTTGNPDNPNVFVKQEEPLLVHDERNMYENKHLPDLRAHFVKEALVEPYFALCRHLNPEAHVLKGFEFKELIKHPEERKVEVFILIYDNETSG